MSLQNPETTVNLPQQSSLLSKRELFRIALSLSGPALVLAALHLGWNSPSVLAGPEPTKTPKPEPPPLPPGFSDSIAFDPTTDSPRLAPPKNSKELTDSGEIRRSRWSPQDNLTVEQCDSIAVVGDSSGKQISLYTTDIDRSGPQLKDVTANHGADIRHPSIHRAGNGYFAVWSEATGSFQFGDRMIPKFDTLNVTAVGNNLPDFNRTRKIRLPYPWAARLTQNPANHNQFVAYGLTEGRNPNTGGVFLEMSVNSGLPNFSVFRDPVWASGVGLGTLGWPVWWGERLFLVVNGILLQEGNNYRHVPFSPIRDTERFSVLARDPYIVAGGEFLGSSPRGTIMRFQDDHTWQPLFNPLNGAELHFPSQGNRDIIRATSVNYAVGGNPAIFNAFTFNEVDHTALGAQYRGPANTTIGDFGPIEKYRGWPFFGTIPTQEPTSTLPAANTATPPPSQTPRPTDQPTYTFTSEPSPIGTLFSTLTPSASATRREFFENMLPVIFR